VPWTLIVYGVFLAVRYFMLKSGTIGNWFVGVSIVVDMAVLMVLIWSFHIQYKQPPAFYLKAPTLLYVFIFISLRALRYEARWVLLAGGSAVVGWVTLILYAVWHPWPSSPITRDYVQYMTSSSILLGAELDKIISIIIVSLILALVLRRARGLMYQAAIDHTAATELARFVPEEVAEAINGLDSELKPGQGEIRQATAMFIDLRKFTILTKELPPCDIIVLLSEFQSRVVPLVQEHGGSIDKFLGDGILASFGAVKRSETHAADAMRALAAIQADLAAWTRSRLPTDTPVPEFSAGLASGDVLFGVVGTQSRIEYTIIGRAVNRAAKLEKHTRVENVAAIVDQTTFDLAVSQGLREAMLERRSQRTVAGLDEPADFYVMKAA
jgi:adenylate cyclase